MTSINLLNERKQNVCQLDCKESPIRRSHVVSYVRFSFIHLPALIRIRMRAIDKISFVFHLCFPFRNSQKTNDFHFRENGFSFRPGSSWPTHRPCYLCHFVSFFFLLLSTFFFAWPQSKLRISWAIVYEGTGGNGEEGEKKRERESEKNTQTRNFSLGGIEMKMDVVPSSLNKHQYKRRSRSPANKKHSRLTKFSER